MDLLMIWINPEGKLVVEQFNKADEHSPIWKRMGELNGIPVVVVDVHPNNRWYASNEVIVKYESEAT